MPEGEAYEEAERVDEEPPHGHERDGAAEPLLYAHRGLDDAGVAEAAGQDEELEVEGEAALAQQGQDVGDDLTVDQLDADLGVLDVQPEQQVDEVLDTPTSTGAAAAGSAPRSRDAVCSR